MTTYRTAQTSPPLLGNGQGIYRIRIVGNSGSGKSTLGMALSKVLNIPFIPLDTVHWKPGWVATEDDELRREIRQALDQCPQGWIVDGNYHRVSTEITNEATDIIWLDPPLILYFPRVVWRTFLRLFNLREPCSEGCGERFSEVFFSKESILLWCLTHHAVMRKYMQDMLTNPSLAPKVHRLGGWGSELRQWWADVMQMVGPKEGKDD
ncbi:hypothetical protein ONZ45_g6428 [Pleurotus djamor]|nr:hypothetical protein ONZ45_g6428 [Pleurotus djamor]